MIAIDQLYPVSFNDPESRVAGTGEELEHLQLAGAAHVHDPCTTLWASDVQVKRTVSPRLTVVTFGLNPLSAKTV
jgi:hypothetical protein